MQTFFNTARVQLTSNGVYFYERDIIMSSYLFNRDLKIDINLDYVRSGFGIVIAEDSPVEPKHSYLYHLGSNSFTVFEKHLLKQYEYSTRTNILSPGQATHLIFSFKKNKGQLYLSSVDNDGTKRETLLGEHTVTRKISTYYVGLYSQAGNTVNDITFLQGVPDRWHCSIANVHGGRISFWDDGFMFENCVHDAELEQKELVLPAGTFWLDYQTSEVNGKYDIEGFVYESYIPDPPSDITDSHYEKDRGNFDERYLEDSGKMLVHNQGSFILTEETSVILSFKGTSGKVDYVCIKDTEHGDYLSTSDQSKQIDGSWLTVDITGVIAFKWEGIIFALPECDDLTKPRSYAIMSTTVDSIYPEALSIELGKQYNYYYDVLTSRLETVEDDTDSFFSFRNLNVTANDSNMLRVFVNMKAQIINFILIMADGSEVNINMQRTYKTFVPGYVIGPIIVTDQNNNSFDLSGSYREVLDPDNYKIDIFLQSALELKLSYHTSTLWQDLEVFGIPRGAVIDDTQTDIKLFSSAYTKLDPTVFSFKNDIITIPSTVRDDYTYIAVRYQRGDKFSYLLTVYERELFAGDENLLQLSAPVNKSGQGITVYGIYQDSFRKDYFLRIPSKEMPEVIDLCADRYDMISPTQYDVDTYKNTIKLNSSLNNRYEYFIVNYMKENSYSVNWNNDGQQYEVDIASDYDIILIHYEMDANGNSSRVIRTDIKSDDSKFIVLKRNKGVSFNDH